MQVFDLCLAADWEQDRGFLEAVEGGAQRRGRSTYVVWPPILEQTLERLRRGELSFRFLLDRASTTSEEYLELYRVLAPVACLDDPRTMLWASDKATMHLEFLAAGIPVPWTLIIDPFQLTAHPPLGQEELSRLGSPFYIKPANTSGGGQGVVADARCLEQVLEARKEYGRDKYLIQEKIVPLEAEGRRFWLRAFYTCGLVHLTWWHDLSHRYRRVEGEEVERFGLQPVSGIVERIASACRLRFFSTEVVFDARGRFVVVDYVNEACDLRRQSATPDGVPDDIVAQIAERVAECVDRELPP